MLGVGQTFADYLIEDVLGQGGMGTVYRARHPRLPRLVALKLLHRAVSQDEELRRRFVQEANVVARLEHPGVVGIYDRGTHDGHLWISMQYIAGTDAARLEQRAAPPGHIVQIIAETADALDYAHSQGVLHRDIKPANILLAPSHSGRAPRAVLTDFGIARLLESDTKLTATGTFTATLAYASPEQLSGEPIDHRADQYSLACTLYTLLAGQTPFPSTNPGQIITGHLAKPVPRLSESRPDLPPPLDDVIARAMAKQRQDRFATCREFAAAATSALHGQRVALGARLAPTALNSRPAPGSPTPQPAPARRAAPPAQPDPTRRDGSPLSTAQPGPAQRGGSPVATAQPDPAQRGGSSLPTAQPDPAQRGGSPLSTAQPDPTRRDSSSVSGAQPDPTRRGGSSVSTAQPDPAQRGGPSYPPMRPVTTRPPSGRAARTGAFLAAILSLFAAYRAVTALREIATWRRYYGSFDLTSELVFIAVIAAALALLLFCGSVALFARRPVGRLAIAASTGILSLAALGATARHIVDFGLHDQDYYAFYAAVLILSLITFAIVVSPATARWLAQRRSGRR
ncbi:serine/threonine-protein kinase [Nocardia altamirensis]|uniref:serine/threonine-protein kinase n=1 Tax=Nocardia altamirensis TaxID=472158 RepID=UPI0009FE46E1|nr:serine/threonine-protein kinase [Nocardia altamirensis]